MTENKNGNVLEYRIEQVENKIDNHEKNCQKDREKKDKEFQDHREKMEKRFDNIEHDLTEMKVDFENMKKDIREIKDTLSVLRDLAHNNSAGILSTRVKLATIGGCIIVGLSILGVIVKFL